MGRHRGDVRPRYGRIAALVSSVLVTAVALLGGIGVLPSAADGGRERPAFETAAADPADDPAPAPVVAPQQSAPVEPDVSLPAASGSGRRVVFSEGRQRVWLVGRGGGVQRTYLVSGSLYDNLDPGTYEVYSRSKDAFGVDDSGTMKYFVRFAHGENAAIGFHDIPIDDGRKVQTVAQLGTPLSHGCVRQRRQDAIALWRFAPLGTTVVVTA